MDYSRTDCIKSYFEIVALVNKGNKLPNEQTETKFFIREGKLFLGIDENQKLLLCIKKQTGWFAFDDAIHSELKQFSAKLLNRFDGSDLNSYIKNQLFKLGD